MGREQDYNALGNAMWMPLFADNDNQEGFGGGGDVGMEVRSERFMPLESHSMCVFNCIGASGDYGIISISNCHLISQNGLFTLMTKSIHLYSFK